MLLHLHLHQAAQKKLQGIYARQTFPAFTHNARWMRQWDVSNYTKKTSQYTNTQYKELATMTLFCGKRDWDPTTAFCRQCLLLTDITLIQGQRFLETNPVEMPSPADLLSNFPFEGLGQVGIQPCTRNIVHTGFSPAGTGCQQSLYLLNQPSPAALFSNLLQHS